MKRTKLLIIGRSGCGKDTIANKLIQDYGLTQLISTTTRPMRYPGENTHVFVTEEEADKLTDRVAETVIDGYQYFATKRQFEENDIYIIDPKGLYDVCKNAPDTDVCVVYVYASRKTRRDRAIWRAADPKVGKETFESRDSDENLMFSDFEKVLLEGDLHVFGEKYPSVKNIIVVNNDAADINKVYGNAERIYHIINDNRLRKTNPYVPMYYEL